MPWQETSPRVNSHADELSKTIRRWPFSSFRSFAVLSRHAVGRSSGSCPRRATITGATFSSFAMMSPRDDCPQPCWVRSVDGNSNVFAAVGASSNRQGRELACTNWAGMLDPERCPKGPGQAEKRFLPSRAAWRSCCEPCGENWWEDRISSYGAGQKPSDTGRWLQLRTG